MNRKTTIKVTTKTYAITIIGEILVDEIYNDSSSDIVVAFGGSPANIAMNMKNLGVDKIAFFGSVGDDLYGHSLLKDLNEQQIDISHITIQEKSTSKVRINKTDATPLPTFYRSADSEIYFTKELEETIKNSSILHFSYWPLAKEPSKSTILKALKVAKESNTLVGFDPNYHDALATEESISHDDLLDMLQYVDIIKPSLDDSIRLFGEGFTNEEYLLKFVDLGITFVIMTLGKDGVIAYYDGEIYRLPSMAKKVVDVTGAGDAFTSGVYTGILLNEDLNTILKFGSACSAYNLANIGSRSYLPHISEIKKECKIGE